MIFYKRHLPITILLYHLTGTQDFSGKPLFRHFTAENMLKFRCVYVLLPLFFSGKPRFYGFTAETLLEFTVPTPTFSAANPYFNTLPLKTAVQVWSDQIKFQR